MSRAGGRNWTSLLRCGLAPAERNGRGLSGLLDPEVCAGPILPAISAPLTPSASSLSLEVS